MSNERVNYGQPHRVAASGARSGQKKVSYIGQRLGLLPDDRVASTTLETGSCRNLGGESDL